jgi:hypothetical protein
MAIARRQVLDVVRVINPAEGGVEDPIKPPGELFISQPLKIGITWKVWKEQMESDKIRAFNPRENEMWYIS